MGLCITGYSHLEFVRPFHKIQKQGLLRRMAEFPFRLIRALREESDIQAAIRRLQRPLASPTRHVPLPERESGLLEVFALHGYPGVIDGHKDGLYRRTAATREESTGVIDHSTWYYFLEMLSALNFQMPLEQVWEHWQSDKMVVSGLLKLICYGDLEGSLGPETTEEIAEDMERRRDLLRPESWAKRLLLSISSTRDRRWIPDFSSESQLTTYRGLYDDVLRALRTASHGGFLFYR